MYCISLSCIAKLIIKLHIQVVMTKSAHTQLSTFLASVRKWTHSRLATISRPSPTRMATALMRTSSTPLPLGVWWVKIKVHWLLGGVQGPFGTKCQYLGIGIPRTIASFVSSVLWQSAVLQGSKQCVNTVPVIVNIFSSSTREANTFSQFYFLIPFSSFIPPFS